MNLYGDWANAVVLARELRARGAQVAIDKKSVGDDIDFSSSDFVFIGCGTERSQRALMRGIACHKDAFIDHIEKAHNRGLSFVVIIDESHHNDTIKANDIIEYFKTNKIIRSSATPRDYSDAFIIEVPETEVILAGMIKKLLVINENFSQNTTVGNELEFLLDLALNKHQDLRNAFLQLKTDINPLIVIQLPNKSEHLKADVERFLDSKQINYENGKLAVWLSGQHENTDNISDNSSTPVAIIIKQAVATGWDCPRAYILVKLRDNMSETFEIQTIGRIRRMPEVKHYESDLLDSCYLYTLDEKFTESVRQHLGTGSLNANKLFLKKEFRKFMLTSEFKTSVPYPRDPHLILNKIYKWYEEKYGLKPKDVNNKSRLELKGYVFYNDIVKSTKTGSLSELVLDKVSDLDTVEYRVRLDTHKHGRERHHNTGEIGRKLSLEYKTINNILQQLFSKIIDEKPKFLSLSIREYYAFIINNYDLIKQDCLDAMASTHNVFQQTFGDTISVKDIGFPQETIFTYNSQLRVQDIYQKNVYSGYLASAEPRSIPEKNRGDLY
jgi:type III restriction enzyme